MSLAQPFSMDGAGPPERRADPRKRTVLVVEDEETVRSALRSLLEPEGFQVLEASTGQEAIGLASETHPDLILMDLVLPGLNGIDAAHHLSKQSETRGIPLIAVTGSWLGDRAPLLRKVGFQSALTKPVRPGLLMAEIRRLLEQDAQQPS